jgi:hypothetical protein
MATSSSKNFEPDVGEFVEEAFERCGLELRTGYDLKTAQRSLNLLLAEWSNRGLNQWTIAQKTVAMVSGTASYAVDTTNGTAAIDVLDAFMRQTTGGSDSDLSMARISRSQYSSIPNKAQTGQPNQFFVDKQITPTIISLKKAPERTPMLKQLYEEEFLRAMSQDEERASFRVSPDLRSYNSP